MKLGGLILCYPLNLQGVPKKTLLLSGFEFFTLEEVFLGVVFHQKLIGDGLMCPTCVLYIENMCFFAHTTPVSAYEICVFTTKKLYFCQDLCI